MKHIRVVQKLQFLNNFLIKIAVFQGFRTLVRARKTARLVRQPTGVSNKSIMAVFTAAFALALALASCASIRAQKPFTVNLNSPKYAAGPLEVQFDKMLGGLKKNDVAVYYYPDDDAVCLEFRAESIIYYQFWSRDGRDAFLAALEQYKIDYEQQNLIAKSSKTKRIYGKAQGYVAWSTLWLLSEQARGVTSLELGYTFKERRPYFSVMQRSAEYKDAESRKTTSSNIRLYFTRAQAEEVAVLFNQEYLDGLEQAERTQQGGLKETLRNILNYR